MYLWPPFGGIDVRLAAEEPRPSSSKGWLTDDALYRLEMINWVHTNNLPEFMLKLLKLIVVSPVLVRFLPEKMHIFVSIQG